MNLFSQKIAQELAVKAKQVEAAIQLLDGGATVPFIARYRKEVTQGLDDTQLRFLEERLLYLRELEDRRQTIINSINEQGKLLPRRLSGNSLKYQRKVSDAVKKARQMALLPYVTDLLK